MTDTYPTPGRAEFYAGAQAAHAFMLTARITLHAHKGRALDPARLHSMWERKLKGNSAQYSSGFHAAIWAYFHMTLDSGERHLGGWDVVDYLYEYERLANNLQNR